MMRTIPSAYRHRITVLVVIPALLLILIYYLMRPPATLPTATGTSSVVSPVNEAIPWRADLAAALVESRQLGKPVLVDFSASWCAPCQAMKRDVWPDPEVARLTGRDFIPVLLDVDQTQGQEAGRRYGIEFIPTILILDSDGRVLRRAGFMSPGELLGFLRRGA